MRKIWKSMFALILALCLFAGPSTSALADTEEEYLADIRIVYAETYDEAKQMVTECGLKNYQVLNENLNEGTGKTGVWLVYATTTDIEDAITDITTMQMDGGYSEGNYQEMLKKSYEEYVKMGNTYVEAIDYFIEAYDEGDFFAESAYRQLNFYTVETLGKTQQKKHSFEGELLGDVFYNGIDVSDLATLFMQGNSYALKNIRSLLAMGVSYNEDGKTYMEKVAEAAEEMNDDPKAFNDEDFEDLLPNIASLLVYMQPTFEELESVEDEFNWEDQEFTKEEIDYSEAYLMATLMRDTEYLDGKTLYEFCVEYEADDDSDDPNLYPLAAALNPGQAAMTKVLHYYDVIRYSVSDIPPELIEEQLAEQEEIYGENPFNVYAGVDRSVFDGTFALTSAASRANSMNEYSLEEALYGDAGSLHVKIATGVGVLGLGITVFAICRTVYRKLYLLDASDKAGDACIQAMQGAIQDVSKNIESLATQTTNYVTHGIPRYRSYESIADGLLKRYMPDVDLSSCTFSNKLDYIDDWYATAKAGKSNTWYADGSHVSYNRPTVLDSDISDASTLLRARENTIANTYSYDGDDELVYNKLLGGGTTTLTAVMYVVGGLMMLYSAITLGVNVYNYYHPEYDDIPAFMVDLIVTPDGDRYVKYDAAQEVTTEWSTKLILGDLNAFEAQRWNALYFTKSYEAGKPLLADFVVSNTNNKPGNNYAPVRRFGEVVSYNLNKYNFDYDTSIYLSVKQSDKQKSAVADVPPIIGSMFSSGLWVLFGSAGALIGVGGTLGTQALLKKKRAKTTK